jgi:hypothetical protein
MRLFAEVQPERGFHRGDDRPEIGPADDVPYRTLTILA